jgi:ribonucleoside-diphosphate reductase beta chain
MEKPLIFEEQISRKPDYYPWTEKFMRAMWEGHWTDKEFSFSSDLQDFKVSLNDKEREIVIRTLSAIAQIEVAVKTFWAKIGDNLPHPSIRDLGYVMANIEVIHNNAYERLLNELGVGDVFAQNLQLEWMSGRVNYLRKYTHKFHEDNKKQFIYSLILFTLFVENVSLFSQFYVIKWFGRKNLLKDTNQQVSYTVREEDIHAKIGIYLINVIKSEYPELFDKDLEEKILHEAGEAFKAESKIIDWLVNGTQTEFLSADILKEFIKNRINESLVQIGYKKIFEIDSKILEKTSWFDEIALGNEMTDFFFQRPTSYVKKSQSFDADNLF